jgi:hypothetical protein
MFLKLLALLDGEQRNGKAFSRGETAATTRDDQSGVRMETYGAEYPTCLPCEWNSQTTVSAIVQEDGMIAKN